MDMFDLVHLIIAFGYIGLFAIVFLESGVFFGFFFPGDSLLFTAGFLASQGTFSIIPLVLILIIAATLGYQTGYIFGQYVGPKIFNRQESRFFKPKHVTEAHTFFIEYGRFATFFARFLPIMRTFVPIVAGVANMPIRNFVLFNLIGGSVWVTGLLLFGYFLGKQIPNAEHYLYPIIITIIVISFLPVIFQYWKSKRRTTQK